MSTAFVPLFTALKNAPSREGFSPIAKPSGISSSPQEGFSKPHRHTPVLNLKRDGDKITEIHITCGCGEVIEIACSY